MSTRMSRAESASLRIKRRRAVGHVAMSLLLPGSAQIHAGVGRAGHTVLRIWITLWIAVAGILIGIWLAPGPTVGVLFHPVTLWTARVGVWFLAAGWTPRSNYGIVQYVRW